MKALSKALSLAAALALIAAAFDANRTSSLAARLQFRDNTLAAGFDLTPDIGGHHGSYVADYDNDGDEDVFMTSHGIAQIPDTGWNALFQNDGTGRFIEVARNVGVGGASVYGRYTREQHGAAWFDYDNDGDFDLYQPDTDSNLNDPNHHGYDELYENQADGTFRRVSTERGFGQVDYARRGVAAADFDRDGFLDLFVLQMIQVYLNPYKETVPSPYRGVYFNQGGKSFCLEGTAGCHPLTGVVYKGWSQGIMTLDYDGDGDVDVVEADEQSGSGLRLWENDGHGNFKDVAAARGLPGAGTYLNCVVGGDVDNDGDIDLYTSGRLYKNNGGNFSYSSYFGFAEHMILADLDNDGDLDMISGGVFLNRGDGSFVQDSTTGLIAEGRGGMAFDADGDGDLDVIMNRSDRYYPYRRFYVNELSPIPNYLKVKLTGTHGQAGAPGAKVYVYEEGHLGEASYLVGYREVVTATGGFVNGPSPVQHFGLASRSAVDVSVKFLLGEVVDRRSVPANTTVSIAAADAPPAISR